MVLDLHTLSWSMRCWMSFIRALYRARTASIYDSLIDMAGGLNGADCFRSAENAVGFATGRCQFVNAFPVRLCMQYFRG